MINDFNTLKSHDMIQDFIVATNVSGKKVLIQVHSIFRIEEADDGGTMIQSIGAGENHVNVKESLAEIIEKMDKKK